MTKRDPLLPILLIDDEKDFLISAEFTLNSHGFSHIKTISDPRQVEPLLETTDVSVIVLDLTMPHITGQELLPQIVEKHPDIPVIVITALNEVETAVQTMKHGAFDYILKPVNETNMVSTIKRALEVNQIRDENTRLKKVLLSGSLEHPEAFDFIISQNSKMYSLFQYIEAIAPTPLPILITGETGTGKELIARAIHRLSGVEGEFVAENVAGLDDQLFSDTLFGHARGAFTGADKQRQGLVERAAGGTLFLDEIGDLRIESQVKLLRLLQERSYYPLGSDVPQLTDTRIIVATLRDLTDRVRQELFRKDLYYRLQAHHIALPTLRERKDDIPLLIDHFIHKAAKELDKTPPAYPPELITLLKTYHFPGNIRELEGMIFDAVSRHKSGVLSMESFRMKLSVDQKQQPLRPEPKQQTISFGDPFPTLKETEEQLVEEALKRSNGNQTIAAGMLGISRRALNNRLQRAKHKNP
ncbi:MAG: sigma-54 dependent transcriptional regulator [candidate division KSB1 bacterium]|nr:sigma-54 dependent transcriptional regulator [candidate division KSB1 bacterium]